MSLKNILWKLLAVLLITMGGAALTCGGNILLSITGLQNLIGGLLYSLWALEIIIIFIWAIRKFFFQTTTWDSQTKRMKILIFLIPVLGAIFTYFFLQMLSGI